MTEDILFDMILFEMIVISESSFEMTLSSKSRKVRNDFLFDMMSDCRFDMTAPIFSRLRRVPAVHCLIQQNRKRTICIKHRTVG